MRPWVAPTSHSRSVRATRLGLALVVSSLRPAQEPADGPGCQVSAAARALCAMEARLSDALRRNDAATLVEVYADAFHLVNYRGKASGRRRVLDAVRSGALRFDSLAVSELRVRAYGSAGVVTGLQRQVARDPGAGAGAHPSTVRFIHVYARSGRRWLLVATQITPVLAGP